MDKLRILIAGDVHGFFSGLQEAVVACSPDLALQCGDFGWLPRLDMFPPEQGFRDKRGRLVPVHFCDGNHDDCKSLRRLAGAKRKACKVAPGVFYQPRGAVLELPGGFTILFAGGASNADKDLRAGRNGTFPAEVLTEGDIASFPEALHMDMVVSHAAPACVAVPSPPIVPSAFPDPSRAALDGRRFSRPDRLARGCPLLSAIGLTFPRRRRRFLGGEEQIDGAKYGQVAHTHCRRCARLLFRLSGSRRRLFARSRIAVRGTPLFIVALPVAGMPDTLCRTAMREKEFCRAVV
jgi:hypothetical protein